MIFSTDKTKLSAFNGSKTAYPLYVTLGIFDAAIRRKPSHYAQMLVGYLPTVQLAGDSLTDADTRLARQRLFHHCMAQILQPLIDAGRHGIRMTGGDGAVRLCFPVVAAYVADHPEQCLVACTRFGQDCPMCPVKQDDFGNHICKPFRDSMSSLRSINRAGRQPTLARADEVLKTAGLNYIRNPFWKDLPHFNIHQSFPPDLLHQIYQGVFKHLVAWLRAAVGDAELDARFQRLPPMHGIRSFSEGISHLTNVSAGEHKQISKQLLGCIVGAVPNGVVRATVALLDFIYIAQYRSHSTVTLEYLKMALNEFHKHKDVFVNIGVRNGESLFAHSCDNY